MTSFFLGSIAGYTAAHYNQPLNWQISCDPKNHFLSSCKLHLIKQIFCMRFFTFASPASISSFHDGFIAGAMLQRTNLKSAISKCLRLERITPLDINVPQIVPLIIATTLWNYTPLHSFYIHLIFDIGYYLKERVMCTLNNTSHLIMPYTLIENDLPYGNNYV